MNKRAILIEILIWTAILSVLFTGGIFCYSKLFVEPNIYNIQFRDINGITKGSPVRFMGINIGYVRELKAKDKHINVQIIVTRKDMKIPNGTMARVEFYGLGGSKSIELMPPEDSNYDGIVTENNIRLADVIKETASIVDIIELIDRYLGQVNRIEVQEGLTKIKNINPNKIIEAGNELTKSEKEFTNKLNSARLKQQDTIESIKNANETLLKFNKFIKK